MKAKISISIIAVFAILSSIVADSTIGERSTRLDSMELNNYMTKDGFNMYFNPAALATQGTGAFLDLGLDQDGAEDTGANAQDTSKQINGVAGAFYNAGDAGVFGVVLNRQNNLDPYVQMNNNGYSFYNVYENNNIDLFYAKSFEGFNLGARLTYGTKEDDYTPDKTNDFRAIVDTNESSANYYNQAYNEVRYENTHETVEDITLQIGAEYEGIQASLTYGMYDYSMSDTDIEVRKNYFDTSKDANVTLNYSDIEGMNAKADGASLLEFAIAYTLKLDEKSTLTTYGVYSAADYSIKGTGSEIYEYTSYDSTESEKKTEIGESVEIESSAISHTIDAITLGASYNLKPVDEVLIVVAGEYTNTKTKTGFSTNKTSNYDYVQDLTTEPNTSTTTNGAIGVQNVPDDIELTSNDISVVIAAEIQATDSLALRFGLRESVYYDYKDSRSNDSYDEIIVNDDAVTTGDDTSNDTSNTVKVETSSTQESDNEQDAMNIAIGFGYKVFENVTIDGLVNADLFLTGPNVISGEQLDNINARLALNYNF